MLKLEFRKATPDDVQAVKQLERKVPASHNPAPSCCALDCAGIATPLSSLCCCHCHGQLAGTYQLLGGYHDGC